MIIDNRDLGTTVVMPTILHAELKVPGPSDESFEVHQARLEGEYPSELLDLNGDASMETDMQACPLLWVWVLGVTVSDRSQFFHAIWCVLPQEGDMLCIQLLEFFKEGLENPRLFPTITHDDSNICLPAALVPLRPLCYEDVPFASPVATSTASTVSTVRATGSTGSTGGTGGTGGTETGGVVKGAWYGSVECVVQGVDLIRSQFNRPSNEIPKTPLQESLLDSLTYTKHVKRYLDMFFNSSSSFLQVMKTLRPQLLCDSPYRGPWERYCVGYCSSPSHVGRWLSLPPQQAIDYRSSSRGHYWVVFSVWSQRHRNHQPAVFLTIRRRVPASVHAG